MTINPIYIFLISILALFINSCNRNSNKVLEEPKYSNEDMYIKHFAYSLVYNEKNEQADWVAYCLKKEELKKNNKRKGNFRVDTLIITHTANSNDYYKSGYDRGHLAPAADMTWSEQAISESFYYSNISPQNISFNRGIWKKLENKVRELSIKYDCIYICTGPIYKGKISTIGDNKVAVPSHFYKALMIYNDTIHQSIAFIIPNKKNNKPLTDYTISIDSLENVIGLDLYFSLPNSKEKVMENSYNIRYWFY